jgi:glucose/arabinose dehydrogenase
MCEIYTYVHIPTGNIAHTCIRLQEELTLQKSVFFYGYPWVEWEKIKTEVVDKDSSKLKEVMTSNVSPFHFV